MQLNRKKNENMGGRPRRHTGGQGAHEKIFKQFLQLNSRKINDRIKKWAKELNRHFSKIDIHSHSEHFKDG